MSDEAPLPEATGEPNLVLRLEGFEGPLDLLLELARAQKVDLAAISILALVDQYLALIEGARRIRLELAADWLVMAAWLAWLKSRLLVPAGVEEAEEAETAADILARRLVMLETIRDVALWLGRRPQLGIDLFGRGAPEDLTEIDRSGLRLDLPSLLRAHIFVMRRTAGRRRYVPRPTPFWSVQDALRRLATLVTVVPGWTELSRFLPEILPADPAAHRAALASTLLASLEMGRNGVIELQQEEDFGPIAIRPTPV